LVFEIIALIAIVVTGGLAMLVLFEPGLRYRVVAPDLAPGSPAFVQRVAAVTDSEVRHADTCEVLTNGSRFYASELAAIAAAGTSVHIEAFIFHVSDIGDRFIAALTERARSGVKVRLVVDAIGSFPTPDRYFAPLRAAGAVVAWYQPIRWSTLKRFNNRTHRELVIIDGQVGYIGGAGIGAHWLDDRGGASPPWRDTMVRVTGSVVGGLQSAFAENWLESTGEILAGADSFPPAASAAGAGNALVVGSAPSPARGSRARVLFQLLLASARKSIEINSPYFLPDPSARGELIRAKQRGVRVRIVTPGEANNHPAARRASRRRYGELLRAGIEIHEYQPGMIHAKILVVDGAWSVLGSTNFDNRSFELNDEVNLAVMAPALAARLLEDFETDLSASRSISYPAWIERPWHERLLAALASFLERQE
jgi:cardiolipin synthase